MSKPRLEAMRLNHHYGAVHAVRDLSLTLNAGELTALIGPNGAGKSTVFGLLAGDFAVKDAQCSVQLNGVDITHHTVQARAAVGMGRSFQTAAPFATLSVMDNLRVAAMVHPHLEQLRLAALPQLLVDSGLEPLKDQAVQNLPYADWKRLDLALALAQNPCVLLLDEPTAGLAPQERTAMMQWVARLAKERDIAVLFTEHNLDAVFAYADRVLVMVRGSMIAQGSAADIAANASVQEAYTGSYQMPSAAPKGVA